MSYTGVELFMEKLKRMVYNNDYPLISNHLPLISAVRPQLRRLYEELHSTIQILFTENENHLHQLLEESVTSLKKRFKDVVEEAHDRVDLFVSMIIFNRFDDFEHSLNLRATMGSIKSIKKELNNMQTDSSLKTQSPATAKVSCTRNSQGSNNRWDENVVGLDQDAKLIMDKLVEDQKRLDVVSIIGMGGIGKTTLATKVFNHPFVVYHFHLRAWVTVSQTYEKRDLLIKILASIGIEVEREKARYSKLRELLHKSLMGNRYLVVIDDIWSIHAWDELSIFFPNNHTGSRILLTSRLKDVSLHAKPDGFIHQLEFVSDEESWEFLHKKVFHGHDCPETLIKPGMQIAKSCHGLPLALVVIAGVLAKEATSKDSWERIAKNVASYVFRDPNRYIETLMLSVNHLPYHLRDCFLYLGGFPEDYEFQATRLIWLWMAEGFIKEAGNQSLEEIAQGYLMELCDRNLVIVHSRKFNGDIKTCSVHDVLRELCLEISTKENFLLQKHKSDDSMVATYKTQRIFTDCFIGIKNATRMRSLLYFKRFFGITENISNCFHSWMLLMVLDLQQYTAQYYKGEKHLRDYFPVQIAFLVHLRYLAIWFNGEDLPFGVCNLRCLQTLVIDRDLNKPLWLPNSISTLVNLRHLWSRGKIVFPPIKKPMNLQSVSSIGTLGDEPKSWAKYFPHIKKLSCFIHPHMENDFKSLTSLEILKINVTALGRMPRFQNKSIMFPVSLKKLTLEGCHLPWISMSKIQALPKLEVLILLKDAFVGPCWDAGEEPFRQLKFLKFQGLDVEQWEASSINFPCLKQLVLEHCKYLQEIPMEIGFIPTLEHIKIYMCNSYVDSSVYRIQKEQHAEGNFDLKIKEGVYDFNDRAKPFFISGPIPGTLSYVIYHLVNSRSRILKDLALYIPEAFILPINPPTVSPACHDTHNSRIWNDKRSKRRPIRRKFSNRDGELRLLQY